MLLIKISQTAFKGELKLLQLFRSRPPSLTAAPTAASERALQALSSNTWMPNSPRAAALMKEQIPNIHLAWGVVSTLSALLVHHCWEPSESEEPLFAEVLHLPPSPKAAPALEILTLFPLCLGVCYFQCSLLIGKRMQPCRMDFMLVVQVSGVLVSKIMRFRLIADSKLPFTMKQNKKHLHFSFFSLLIISPRCFFFFLLFMWKAFSHPFFLSLHLIWTIQWNNSPTEER